MIDKRKWLAGLFDIIGGLVIFTLLIIALTTTQTSAFERLFKIVALLLFGGIGILFIRIGIINLNSSYQNHN